MSHKVITALLEKVWRLAEDMNHPIRLIQKADGSMEVPWESVPDAKKLIDCESGKYSGRHPIPLGK